jgi:single-stranded DNA-binding protein
VNAVHLVGNIGDEIELREFPARDGGDDKIRATFLLAVDRPSSDGEPDWIRVVVWGVQARNLPRFNGKGSRIGIDGHIRGEWYDPPAAGKGAKPPSELRIKVVAERIEYLSAKRVAVAQEAA